MKSALLLSGGMDSVCLAWAYRPELAITIDYGQRAAEAEITASRAVCAAINIRHCILRVDCSSVGSGDMAGTGALGLAPSSDWWPYRNQLLITLAGTKAVSENLSRLLIGSVKSDGTHRDGTSEFVGSICQLMAYQEGGLLVEAPAIEITTAELIRMCGIPPGLLAWTHSCHKANVPCSQCRGCNKYLQTYEELGYDLDRSRNSKTAY